MENENLNPMDHELDYEELPDSLEEIVEETYEEIEEADEAAETKREKLLRKCAEVKNRCVDGAKAGYGAAKNGVGIAKDRCVDVAKSGIGVAKRGVDAAKNGVGIAKDHCVDGAKAGYSAVKNGCGTAKTRCVNTAKTIAAKAKAIDCNPHFKQTRTYKLEMLGNEENAEPVETLELSNEKEFSLRSLAIASGVVIALTITAGVLVGTLLDD